LNMPVQPTYVDATFRDPYCHAQALVDWDQLYEQLSAGPYVGRVRAVRSDSVEVVEEHVNRALRQSSYGRRGYLTIAFSPEPVQEVASLGAALPERTVLLANEQCEINLVAPENFVTFAVSLPAQRVPQSVLDCLQAHRSSSACIHTVEPMLHRQLLTRARAMLDVASASCSAVPSDCLESQAREVFELAAHELIPVDQPVRSNATRLFAKARALAFALVDSGTAPSIELICSELAISRRTLQNVFLEVVGLSPLQYLKLARLNAARGDFVARAALGTAVGDVASKWGFWHHSQFARDYFIAFGELPAATLRARGGFAPR
jgi:AraC family transcriptional regulator, ethanolamine operon transcriptional activator